MKFLDKAIKISYELFPFSVERFSHYCFLFDKNRLLSIGNNNSTKENAKVIYFANRFNVEHFKKYGYPHAEISCIGKVWGRHIITGKENLVVIRIGKSGKLLDSKPCNNCSIVLKALGFTKVYHSITDSIIESQL